MNNDSDSSSNKMENPFYKFEDNIEKMVKNAPQFAEKIKMAPPEYRETLLEIGSLMKKIIKTLDDNMKGVEVWNYLEKYLNICIIRTFIIIIFRVNFKIIKKS